MLSGRFKDIRTEGRLCIQYYAVVDCYLTQRIFIRNINMEDQDKAKQQNETLSSRSNISSRF